MEHRITHACGHEQDHHIPGFAAQQERKARWLRTTACRACFRAGKRAEGAEAEASDAAVVAPLVMVDLTGSERQVGWASGIRAGRIATLVRERGLAEVSGHPCLAIDAAKWWIDHRTLADDALLARAEALLGGAALFPKAA